MGEELASIKEFYVNYNRSCPVTFHTNPYDRYYDILEKKLMLEAVFRYLKKWDNSNLVLDLGCGGGRYLKLLKNLKFKTFGCDLVLESLLDLKDNFSTLVCLDAHHLAFRESIFSLVIGMFGVFSHCSDVIKAFKEVERILKKEGIFIISVYSWRPLYKLFSIKEIINKFKKYFIRKQIRKDAEEMAFDGSVYTRTFWSASLNNMLEETGFNILEIRGISVLGNILSPHIAKKFPKISEIFYKISFPLDYFILGRLPLIRELSTTLLCVARKK